jgi:hypothetical protein
MLFCGHTVGEVCMTAWLASANAQATSCPHCKHTLPMPEQTHYYNLRKYHNVVEGLFSHTLTTALEVYRAKTAMKWASVIMSDINKHLRRNSSQFRAVVAHASDSRLIIARSVSYEALPGSRFGLAVTYIDGGGRENVYALSNILIPP